VSRFAKLKNITKPIKTKNTVWSTKLKHRDPPDPLALLLPLALVPHITKYQAFQAAQLDNHQNLREK